MNLPLLAKSYFKREPSFGEPKIESEDHHDLYLDRMGDLTTLVIEHNSQECASKRSQFCAQTLTKGDRVYIDGEGEIGDGAVMCSKCADIETELHCFAIAEEFDGRDYS